MATITQNVERLIELFTDVATGDPLAALMLLAGSVFIAVSVGVFGILSAGSVVGWIRRLLPA